MEVVTGAVSIFKSADVNAFDVSGRPGRIEVAEREEDLGQVFLSTFNHGKDELESVMSSWFGIALDLNSVRFRLKLIEINSKSDPNSQK